MNDFLSGRLVSSRSDIADLNRNRPVLVVGHGFSASPYEWISSLGVYLANNGPDANYLVSYVLLGGHGSLADLEHADADIWLSPFLDEYERLRMLGFSFVFIGGVSVSGALILKALYEHLFSVVPSGIVLVDPYFKAQNMVMNRDSSIAWLISKCVRFWKNKTLDRTALEQQYWYMELPTKALYALSVLLDYVEEILSDKTFDFFVPTFLISAKEDTVASFVGSRQFVSRFSHVLFRFVLSDRHVCIRGCMSDRLNWSCKDEALKLSLLSDIVAFMDGIVNE